MTRACHRYGLALLGCMALTSCTEKTPAERLAGWGLHLPQAAQFTLEGDPVDFGPEEPRLLKARSGSYRLRVIGTPVENEAAAERQVAEQQAMLTAMFAPKLPPYPEFLTREAGCPDAFKPTRIEGPSGTYFLLFASERLGFGVCAEDVAHYRAAVAFLGCPANGAFFSIQAFVPRGNTEAELKRIMESARCT